MLGHKAEIISLSISKAREGLESWKTFLSEIARLQAEAVGARYKCLDGLRMISYWGLTSEFIQFAPFFPINGSFSVPYPKQTRLNPILERLEGLVLEIEVTKATDALGSE